MGFGLRGIAMQRQIYIGSDGGMRTVSHVAEVDQEKKATKAASGKSHCVNKNIT